MVYSNIGIEIVVVVSQPLEPFEILIMEDRAEKLAELPELFACFIAGDQAVFN